MVELPTPETRDWNPALFLLLYRPIQGTLWAAVVAEVVLCAQLCLTLCNPMDYRQPDSPVHGIF